MLVFKGKNFHQGAQPEFRLLVSRKHRMRGHRDLGMRIWSMLPDKSLRLASMPAEGERNLKCLVNEDNDGL